MTSCCLCPVAGGVKREGEGGLPNEWLPNQPTAFHRNWTEADMLALSEESGGAFQVVGAVYVECFNRPALEEARWALRMADDPSSVVEAVVAHIPVPDGGAAVRAFLDALRENGEEGKRLPRRLRGGRVVLFGHPPDHCATSQKYAEGLRELRRSGEGRLLWEWCCWPACSWVAHGGQLFGGWLQQRGRFVAGRGRLEATSLPAEPATRRG